jgi:hypothetical protein
MVREWNVAQRVGPEIGNHYLSTDDCYSTCLINMYALVQILHNDYC